jgi:hypothetical protein
LPEAVFAVFGGNRKPDNQERDAAEDEGLVAVSKASAWGAF